MKVSFYPGKQEPNGDFTVLESLDSLSAPPLPHWRLLATELGVTTKWNIPFLDNQSISVAVLRASQKRAFALRHYMLCTVYVNHEFTVCVEPSWFYMNSISYEKSFNAQSDNYETILYHTDRANRQ